MTNPNNAIGTVGAYGGRTSVNAFNDCLHYFSGRGVMSGWKVTPESGMTVSVGGVSGVRDVAIVEDPNGNLTTVNNISGSPILVEMPTAPSTNPRWDYIVVYVNNPATVQNTTLDNPGACGIIAIPGTSSGALPVPPREPDIRDAITADGGTGATAYYAIIAQIVARPGTTVITPDMIVDTLWQIHPNVDSIYPVGAIYISVSNMTPDTLFGGRWERISDRFLLAASETYPADSTGGEATHVHASGSYQADMGNYGGRVYFRKEGTAVFSSTSYIGGTSEGDNVIIAQGTNVSGASESASSMPPYLAVYMWKRVA